MTMHVAAYGRLGQDPRSIETKSNKPMCVCSIAVELSGRDGATSTQWMGIVAFGRVAEDLARHAKGDPVGVSGRAQQNTYTKTDGAAVTELQILADAIVSARTVRPGGRRKSGERADAARSQAEGAPFNDEIPQL